MSHENQCDCPLCPLLKNNVQVCDVLIKENPKTKKYTVYHDEGLSKENADNLYKLLVGFIHRTPIKVGQSIDSNGKEFDAYIEHKRRDLYKVCFHAKKKEEEAAAAEAEEDPMEVR
jgi:hypothetical protein